MNNESQIPFPPKLRVQMSHIFPAAITAIVLVDSWDPHVIYIIYITPSVGAEVFRKEWSRCKTEKSKGACGSTTSPCWLPQRCSTFWWLGTKMSWSPLKVTRDVPAHKETSFANDLACSQAQAIAIKVQKCFWGGNGHTLLVTQLSGVQQERGWPATPISYRESKDASCPEFCMLCAAY